MTIQLLPAELANQIAAGEVVERPASVVKELVENSLDAGASKIEIEIQQGGHKQILIRDNGSGIPKNELALALSRHATSKIHSLDDLEAIQSMGFRGEALASISSVSRLTLTSRTAEQTEAWQAQTQGRDMQVNVQPAAHPTGTSIDVLDLFFNTPARRRFLRTPKTEFTHIETVVKRIALAHPSIEFVLKHNGRRHLQCKPTSDLHKRIHDVLGKPSGLTLIDINAVDEAVSLKGFIVDCNGPVELTDWQYSYVNGRPMKDKLINHAIKQAYELLGIGRDAPQYILFVDVEPSEIDVNVHPAKHEVRFHQSRLVHDFIVSHVKQALQSGFSEALAEDNVHLHAEPSHGYQAPNQLQSEKQAPNRSTLAQSHYGGGQGASSGFSQSAGKAYSSLMTIAERSMPLSRVQCITLRETILVALNGADRVYMVNKQRLLTAFLRQQLSTISVAQPLLMPVAVSDSEEWSEARRVAFEGMHFHIDKVAQKRVLKQVPAGWRAMPWSSLFTHFGSIDINDAQASLTELLSNTLAKQEYPFNNVIAWFDGLPEEHQQALLEQQGEDFDEKDLLRLLAEGNLAHG
ncbi:DNA mismatch repair endonuclease MutL [Alteromonas facilis]|uniref:DNA mismatch repair endonuclease MutL n=1 Tax=Alteromonas facilis TaxID=2048004 RepID=UPI000C285CDB|nr:DNA mismatch repair endonuclease MutL [Alteromonas facilis]